MEMNKSSIIPETDNRKQRIEQSWQDLYNEEMEDTPWNFVYRHGEKRGYLDRNSFIGLKAVK